MPRYAHYQLKWVEQAQNYILSIGDQASEQALTSDWLERIASFTFHSRSGTHYTVRKQKVQRGSLYWYGYRRLHGRIVKRYLGRTADLTLARLEEIAHLLENLAGSRQRSIQSHEEAASSQPAPHVAPSVDASPVGVLPLLLSKLSPPRLHSFLLERSRLFGLLDAGREGPLTLLSTPAGFGKTTLICQWMAARRTRPDFPPVAWVSLEPADNDLMRFWRYLITACQTFQVDLQEVHSALLEMTPQLPFMLPSLEIMLTSLLNALALCPARGILVLEDYHVITSQEIHETVSFFLDHLPANMHLIILTRSDPPFSLARLRARNELDEIRTADLRFSQEETMTLFQQVLSSPLTAEAILHLHAQLEGWGTGLQLVKLALQRTTAQASEAFHLPPGGMPSFQEYFVTEVLDLQPEPVQQFLLQTSILTRLTGSLCDALIEQDNSQNMLTMLERENLFLDPLDATGQWYRYHALFAEAMRKEARHRIGEDQLQRLSARASHWYEAHGFLSEAIDAALSALDYTRAATLIERSIEMQTAPGEPHTLHRWFGQLPETILAQHPALCLNYATTLLFLNPTWRPGQLNLSKIEKLLHMAEQSFLMENQFPKLGELFAFRSLLTWRQGEIPAAAKYAQQALAWLPETQQTWRGLSLCMVAIEWLEMGQFQKARPVLFEAQAICEAAGNHYFKLISTLLLARTFFEQGELQRASISYRQALASIKEGRHIGAVGSALIGLAALSYEWNELEGAYQQAQEAIALSQSRGLDALEVQATLILSRIQQVQGQVTAAQQQLAALFEKTAVPQRSQEIQTAQARLALSIGDHMTMQRWATGRSPHPDFSQQLEEELLLARWLRIQGKEEEALLLLERLLVAAREMEYTRRILEIQVEMVLIAVARKRKAEAQHLLREVLVQAFDRNYVRLFLDAGEQMTLLLRSLLPQLHEQPLRAYVRTLLNAFPVQQQEGTPMVPLIETLSPQEMRVLRLLVGHRSNAEIASELVVSINTVRTQVQSIYRKLGVNKRSAASEVARELNLL